MASLVSIQDKCNLRNGKRAACNHGVMVFPVLYGKAGLNKLSKTQTLMNPVDFVTCKAFFNQKPSKQTSFQ